jgi:hypothetical protein
MEREIDELKKKIIELEKKIADLEKSKSPKWDIKKFVGIGHKNAIQGSKDDEGFLRQEYDDWKGLQ